MTTNMLTDEAGSGVKHTINSSQSVLSAVLQKVIRPFRPHLVKPGKPVPAGSPQLHPPSTSKCRINERFVNSIYVYDFSPLTDDKSHVRSPKQHLYYFAGGGFQSPPSREHWKLCIELSGRLAALYDVTLVSYPLAPNSPSEASLPALRKWMKSAVEDARGKGQRITLAGDSAGGNVVLSLGFWWAGQLSSDGTLPTKAGATGLKSLFVISPPTDLRNQNPRMEEADRLDHMLGRRLVEQVAQAWAGTLPRSDPTVSPVLADFDVMKRAGIMIHGVVGSHDVLAPDAIRFQEMCQKHAIAGNWLLWERQMHCFPLAGVYGLSEGRRGIEWIIDVLKSCV